MTSTSGRTIIVDDMLHAQYHDERMTALAVEIQEQIADLIRDGEMPADPPEATAAAMILAGEPVGVMALAAVARGLLAWDSWSFLSALDVEHTGGVRAVPTALGYQRLSTLGMRQPIDFGDWDS